MNLHRDTFVPATVPPPPHPPPTRVFYRIIVIHRDSIDFTATYNRRRREKNLSKNKKKYIYVCVHVR